MKSAVKPVKKRQVVKREKRLSPKEYRLKAIYLKEWKARMDDNTWWENSLGNI